MWISAPDGDICDVMKQRFGKMAEKQQGAEESYLTVFPAKLAVQLQRKLISLIQIFVSDQTKRHVIALRCVEILSSRRKPHTAMIVGVLLDPFNRRVT